MAIKKLANNSNQPPKKNAAQTGGAKNTPQVKKISLNAPIKTSSVVNQKTDSIFNSSSAFGKKPVVSLSSAEEQEAMQAIFSHLDTDEDGKISEEELTYLTSMHDDNDEGEEITEEDVNLYLEKMEGERQQTLDRFQGALGQWVGGIDDVIAKYFPSKSLDEISDEDIQRAVFADMLSSNTANARNNIEQYFDSEGWADDAYNWLKGITDLGITRDDINEYLQNEEMFNNILLSSLNNGGSLELVDSDEPQEELLANGQISTSMLQGIIEQRLSNASSVEEIMDYSQNYLGLDGEDVLNSIMSTMLDQQLKYSPYCAQYNPEDLQFEITQGEDGEYYISSDYSLLSGKVLDVNGLTVDEYFELYLAGDLKQNVVESISSKWQENTPESISFDDTYSFFTGVKYDPQAIQEANEAQIVYQHAISLQQGASYQEELFASFNSPRQVYDYFVQMYENDPSVQNDITAEEYASSMFNSYYDSLFENGLVTGDARIDLRCTSFHISPDGKTITEVYSAGDFFSESYLNEGEVYDEKTGTVTRQYNIEYDPVSDSYYSQTLSDTFACINRVVDDEDLFVQSTIDGFNEQYGENAFNLAIQDYQEKFETAYGNNILNSKFDSYQVDMDSYSQKLSTFIAMGGFAMSFINPAFGFVALGGAYTDNAIDLVNLATNEKGGEFGDWFLSTMKDVCYTAVGFKLGAWANQSGNKLMGFLMNKGVSQNAALGLGTGGEYILDVASGTAFDLATSYMETGNIYLAQNLMNNFLFGSADFRGGVGLYRALHAGYDIDVDVSGNIKVVDPDGVNSARPAVFGSADTDAPDSPQVRETGIETKPELEVITETKAEIEPDDISLKQQDSEVEPIKNTNADGFEIQSQNKITTPDEQTIEARRSELTAKGVPNFSSINHADVLANLPAEFYDGMVDLYLKSNSSDRFSIIDVAKEYCTDAGKLSQFLSDINPDKSGLEISIAKGLLGVSDTDRYNALKNAIMDDSNPNSKAKEAFKGCGNFKDFNDLTPEQFSRAMYLAEEYGIKYYYLTDFAKLDSGNFAKAEQLYKEGINPQDIQFIMQGHISNVDMGTDVNGISKWEKINSILFGERPQGCRVHDGTITLSNGQSVTIHFANNIIDSYTAKEIGIDIGADSPYDVISTHDLDQRPKSLQIALERSLNDMAAHGQNPPSDIYFVSYSRNTTDGGSSAAVFAQANPNALFINSDLSAFNYAEAMYMYPMHEAGHLNDAKTNESMWHSSKNIGKKVINRNALEIQIPDTDIKVQTDDIRRFLGDYAVMDEREFVAEFSFLISSGQVVQDAKTGEYRIKTNTDGTYFRPHETTVLEGESSDFTGHYNHETDADAFNRMMLLYNKATEGNQYASRPEIVDID